MLVFENMQEVLEKKQKKMRYDRIWKWGTIGFALFHIPNTSFYKIVHRITKNQKNFVIQKNNQILCSYMCKNIEFMCCWCVFEKKNVHMMHFLVKISHFHTIRKYEFFLVKICVGPPKNKNKIFFFRNFDKTRNIWLWSFILWRN